VNERLVTNGFPLLLAERTLKRRCLARDDQPLSTQYAHGDSCDYQHDSSDDKVGKPQPETRHENKLVGPENRPKVRDGIRG